MMNWKKQSSYRSFFRNRYWNQIRWLVCLKIWQINNDFSLKHKISFRLLSCFRHKKTSLYKTAIKVSKHRSEGSFVTNFALRTPIFKVDFTASFVCRKVLAPWGNQIKQWRAAAMGLRSISACLTAWARGFSLWGDARADVRSPLPFARARTCSAHPHQQDLQTDRATDTVQLNANKKCSFSDKACV